MQKFFVPITEESVIGGMVQTCYEDVQGILHISFAVVTDLDAFEFLGTSVVSLAVKSFKHTEEWFTYAETIYGKGNVFLEQNEPGHSFDMKNVILRINPKTQKPITLRGIDFSGNRVLVTFPTHPQVLVFLSQSQPTT